MRKTPDKLQFRDFYKIPDQYPQNRQNRQSEGSLRNCHDPKEAKEGGYLPGWAHGSEKGHWVQTKEI